MVKKGIAGLILGTTFVLIAGTASAWDNCDMGYTHGYVEAQTLWDNTNYRCEPSTVHRDFGAKVNSEVVHKTCKAYNPFHDAEWMRCCEHGAYQFVDDKAWECTSIDQCEGYGLDAADEIANYFCATSAGPGGTSNTMTPEICMDLAVDECRAEVGDIVEDRIKSRNCPRHPAPLTLSELMALKDKCDYVLVLN